MPSHRFGESPIAAGPIVLAFNAGDRGRSVESSSPKDLMTGALPIARQLFGDNIYSVEVRTSSWTTDPYLAGEAVGVNNPVTVHGAVLSGQYAGAELMRRLR